MIKAVFFDIDGTLVGFKSHVVPPSAVEAIEELRRRGIKVFIATGRHLQFIDNLGELQFDGYITLNGSYCYAGRDKVIFQRCIPAEDIHKLICFQEEQEPFPCIFVRENDSFLNNRSSEVEEMSRMVNFPCPPVKNIREADKEDVFQLLAFFTPEQEARIMPVLANCEATRWTSLFADVVPAGSNKRVGMQKILEYFGISCEETMAFGDGGNDIPMLTYANIGVAMGGSAPEVCRAADFVTRSVDEDGVMFALRHFGLIR